MLSESSVGKEQNRGHDQRGNENGSHHTDKRRETHKAPQNRRGSPGEIPIVLVVRRLRSAKIL